MMEQTFSVVYSTAPDEKVAKSIAKTLVQENLIGCANLLPQVTSVYEWDGDVQTDPEVVMIMKTRTELVDAVMDRVNQLHPYEIPCLTSWELTTGSTDYFNWIYNETER